MNVDVIQRRRMNMAKRERKAPRNRDQDVPPRKGESIESTVPDRGKGERDRSAPLPEEESYEREPQDQRPKS
jgi:hypothetical protein